MSKLQLRRRVVKLSRLIGNMNLRRFPAKTPPIVAKREFSGIESENLSDMVCSVAEMRYGLYRISDNYFGAEFESMIEESDRLIQRLMIEIVRRNNLPSGRVSYLLRLVNSDIPNEVAS